MTSKAPPASTATETCATRRRLISLSIVAFLMSQVAIPLSYYLSAEPTSERFAWRMFSSVDLSSWDTKVLAVVEHDGKLIEREIPLNATLQETYVKAIRRAQLDIVEPFMRQLSEQDGVRAVRFEARGFFPSGKAMKPIRLSMDRGQVLERTAN